MSNGHCFISYSNGDADEFGPNLGIELEGGYPYIETWFDKRGINAGSTWDEKVPDAIKACKCLLLVLTKDGVAKNSICAEEYDLAFRYKKPILLLRLHEDIEVPFRLGRRQWIDFTASRKEGLAKLRHAILRLDKPEGQLDTLKYRLADAERDLRRANDAEKPRIQADIDNLNADIERQEKVVENPEAAKEQTTINIQSGLERERQPETPIVKKSSTKFINPAPGIAPTYFQDRQIETQEVVKFLQDDALRLMTVIGRGGVGKTAMVCRLLKHIENSTLPEGIDWEKLRKSLPIGGIVYLSETGSHKINFGNIFADLSKLLPDEIAEELVGRFKDPQASAESKMNALLSHFQEERILLLLDNFEPLIDAENAKIKDDELDAALRTLLSGTHHSVNVLITTRIAPRELNLHEPGRQRILSFDEGLEFPHAENILREMDSDGKLGLEERSEDDPQLQRAREKTRGYPRALEAFFAILSSDRYTTLEELLEMPLPENVVEALVGEAFSRLDANAQKVMQALAIYNRPVTPAAVDYLLQPHLPEIDSAPILKRLVNMHFARYEAGRFYLHPVDYDFAFGLLAKGNEITVDNPEQAQLYRSMGMQPPRKERTDFTQTGLTDRAASYFVQARKPRAEWKKLADLNAQLAEFDLRCSAGDYDTAASVLTEFDGEYLLLWGHYHLMIAMYERIQTKISDSKLRMFSLNSLGLAYYSIGKTHQSIISYQDARKFAIKLEDRWNEGAHLGNLGNAYADLGEAKKSIEYYEQALVIAREIGDRRGEGTRLGNLGNAYASLGEAKKAIEYYEQALVIAREIGNRQGEGVHLGNLALQLATIERYSEAITRASEGVIIGIEISSVNLGGYNNYFLAYAHFFSGDLPEANSAIKIAAEHDEKNNNHNVSTLHGIIALRQEDNQSAQAAFRQAIAQAGEILAKTPELYNALDAKGLALCGLALVERGNLTGLNEGTFNSGEIHESQHDLIEAQGDLSGLIAQAIESFQKAREIAPHAGVVKGMLRLFDELVKCDEENVLESVRKAVEG